MSSFKQDQIKYRQNKNKNYLLAGNTICCNMEAGNISDEHAKFMLECYKCDNLLLDFPGKLWSFVDQFQEHLKKANNLLSKDLIEVHLSELLRVSELTSPTYEKEVYIAYANLKVKDLKNK